MTRIAPQSREPVVPEKRRPFRKADIETALFMQDRRCFDCGEPIPPFQADHDKPRDLGGKTVLENLCLRCIPCHARKTAERDRPMIDKARRIRNKEANLAKPKRRINSPRFNRKLRKRMNGTVEVRT